jgi:hypothetical protein
MRGDYRTAIVDDSGVSLPRILATVAALAVCVWFAIGIRQAIDTDHASAIISSSAPLTEARVTQARSLLSTAAQLNPDRQVDLLRAQLDIRLGEDAKARALALSVASAEPQNSAAWLELSHASPGDDATLQLSYERLYGLVPPLK